MNSLIYLADIVGRVQTLESPPYRPDIPYKRATADEACVIELMKRCWDETPEQRPSFDDILKALQRMHGGR